MNQEIVTMYKKFDRSAIPATTWWEFINDKNRDEVREVVEYYSAVRNRLRRIKESFTYRTRVRKFVSYFLYSDVHAYEVIRQVSPKVVEIRRLNARNLADMGGQKWEFESNPEAPIEKLRLSSNGWGRGRYVMTDSPYESYDWTF